jgi:hypothetical protein
MRPIIVVNTFVTGRNAYPTQLLMDIALILEIDSYDR